MLTKNDFQFSSQFYYLSYSSAAKSTLLNALRDKGSAKWADL